MVPVLLRSREALQLSGVDGIFERGQSALRNGFRRWARACWGDHAILSAYELLAKVAQSETTILGGGGYSESGTSLFLSLSTEFALPDRVLAGRRTSLLRAEIDVNCC